MQSASGRIIIACAGSGKTTRLVKDALEGKDRRIAIITYTNNNLREIHARFGDLNSGVPPHVDVMTWYEFLLRECARPYQRAKHDEEPIPSLAFVNQKSTRYTKASDTARYYLSRAGGMYSDKISRFVVECEEASGHRVSARIGRVYTDLFIDEFQDLAGWDLEVVRMLLTAGIPVTLVGDPRQHIYQTNPASKNKQYLGTKITDLVSRWKKDGWCELEYMDTTHRCAQEICDFTNLLWPGMTAMTSTREHTSDHEGVYLVDEVHVSAYLERFAAQVLRNTRRSPDYGAEAMNFGVAKGLEFDHVLIVPTGPIKRFLETGGLQQVMAGRDRLHVAVTRARMSVAFVSGGPSPVVKTTWKP